MPDPPSNKSSKRNPKTLITETGKSQPEDTVDMAASIVSGSSVSDQSLSSESDISVCGNLFLAVTNPNSPLMQYVIRFHLDIMKHRRVAFKIYQYCTRHLP